jgi:hypothetical protein
MKHANLKEDKNSLDLSGILLQLVAGVVILTAIALLYFSYGESMTGLPKRGIVPVRPEGFAFSGQYEVDSNGIHVPTGLMYGPGIVLVQKHCLACHSSTLVTQSRATREGWHQTIRWMQQTQGLWDLGTDEPLVLDYLATYYAPEEQGRRAVLDQSAIEWYVLENEDPK